MGKFHESLTDAQQMIEEGRWDEAIEILELHKSNDIDGIFQRMMTALDEYQDYIDKAIKAMKDRNANSPHLIGFAKDALSLFKTDIRELIETEKIKLE